MGSIIALIFIVLLISYIMARIIRKKRKKKNQSNAIKTITKTANINQLLSTKDTIAIASSAQRMVDIINESLKIANTTKDQDIKVSRVRLARQRFNELRNYSNKFTFIKIDKLHEVDTNIKEFEAQIEKYNIVLIKPQDDKTYYQNREVLKGLIFHATLQVRTPLSVLIHHGERFKGPPSKAPKYGTEADGFWNYETTTWRELGINIDEFPEVNGASDVGPVKASEYIPFLIDFRKIVEGQESVDVKIANIKKLCGGNKRYQQYFRRLNEFYKYKGDFPASFFYNQFTQIPGIGQKSAKVLFETGIKTLDDMKNADDRALLAAPGIGPSSLKKIRAYFNNQR